MHCMGYKMQTEFPAHNGIREILIINKQNPPVIHCSNNFDNVILWLFAAEKKKKNYSTRIGNM